MKDQAVKLFALAILLAPLVPVHYPPINGFYVEWVFATLSLLTWLLARNWGSCASLKSPVAGALFLVAAAAIIQGFVGRGESVQLVLVPLYCLFGVGVYMFAKGALAEGRSGFEELLASALVCSGLLACVPAAFQLNRIEPGFLLVMPRIGDAVYGNFAQPNHLADWLWLCVFALAFLVGRRRVRYAVAMPAVVVFTFFSLATGSRSVWLFAAAPLLLTLLLVQRSKAGSEGKAFQRVVLAASLSLLGGNVILSLTGGYEFFGLVSNVQRIVAHANAGELRFGIWASAVDVMHSHPLVGVGPGRFSWAMLQSMLDEQGAGTGRVSEHAHNLLLDLGAELGVPVALGVSVLVGWWLVRFLKTRLELSGLWVMSSLCVVGIHSMLEYPLWYAQFIALTSVYFAVGEGGSAGCERERRLSPNAMRIAGTFGLAVLAAFYLQYRPVEWALKQMEWQLKIGYIPFLSPEMKDKLGSVPAWSPFRSYADAATVVAAIPVAGSDAGRWADVCERIVSFSPVPVTLGRCAVVLAVAGRYSEADHFAELGCRANPGSAHVFQGLVVQFSRVVGLERLPVAECLKG